MVLLRYHYTLSLWLFCWELLSPTCSLPKFSSISNINEHQTIILTILNLLPLVAVAVSLVGCGHVDPADEALRRAAQLRRSGGHVFGLPSRAFHLQTLGGAEIGRNGCMVAIDTNVICIGMHYTCEGDNARKFSITVGWYTIPIIKIAFYHLQSKHFLLGASNYLRPHANAHVQKLPQPPSLSSASECHITFYEVVTKCPRTTLHICTNDGVFPNFPMASKIYGFKHLEVHFGCLGYANQFGILLYVQANLLQPSFHDSNRFHVPLLMRRQGVVIDAGSAGTRVAWHKFHVQCHVFLFIIRSRLFATTQHDAVGEISAALFGERSSYLPIDYPVLWLTCLQFAYETPCITVTRLIVALGWWFRILESAQAISSFLISRTHNQTYPTRQTCVRLTYPSFLSGWLVSEWETGALEFVRRSKLSGICCCHWNHFALYMAIQAIPWRLLDFSH